VARGRAARSAASVRPSQEGKSFRCQPGRCYELARVPSVSAGHFRFHFDAEGGRRRGVCERSWGSLPPPAMPCRRRVPAGLASARQRGARSPGDAWLWRKVDPRMFWYELARVPRVAARRFPFRFDAERMWPRNVCGRRWHGVPPPAMTRCRCAPAGPASFGQRAGQSPGEAALRRKPEPRVARRAALGEGGLRPHLLGAWRKEPTRGGSTSGPEFRGSPCKVDVGPTTMEPAWGRDQGGIGRAGPGGF
jgi:hypothetical protein